MCQNLEATEMPFGRWMDKETVGHPDNGILFGAQKESAIKPSEYMEGPGMHSTEWEKTIWEGSRMAWLQLCDIVEKAKLGRQ